MCSRRWGRVEMSSSVKMDSHSLVRCKLPHKLLQSVCVLAHTLSFHCLPQCEAVHLQITQNSPWKCYFLQTWSELGHFPQRPLWKYSRLGELFPTYTLNFPSERKFRVKVGNMPLKLMSYSLKSMLCCQIVLEVFS